MLNKAKTKKLRYNNFCGSYNVVCLRPKSDCNNRRYTRV